MAFSTNARMIVVEGLGDELGVMAALEAAQAVWLQLVGGPDPLHRPQVQTGSQAIIQSVQWGA